MKLRIYSKTSVLLLKKDFECTFTHVFTVILLLLL